MKVIVLGAGVHGVATAYYLARAGHEVTVLERENAPALGASSSYTDEISSDYSAPWATPGFPLKALKSLFTRHSPLILRPHLNFFQWAWMAQMLRNCTPERYNRNKSRMVRLAEYSRDVLRELRAETGICYDERSKGTLQLFRKNEQIDAAAADTEVLKQYGVPHEALDAAGCVRQEPALADVREKIAGGLFMPGEETGDCFKFTQALAEKAKALGVVFRFGVDVLHIDDLGDSVDGVEIPGATLRADAYVVALGSSARALLRPMGLSLPVYPVKSYSLTIPVADEDGAPQSMVMDETHKVSVTRLGDRMRVAGIAEINGYNFSIPSSRRETLAHVARDLFPSGGDPRKAEYWCGMRPMTPDGSPIIGATIYNNLFLNAGHGASAWTMACGSGRLLSDIVSGGSPDIDPGGLGLGRYAA